MATHTHTTAPVSPIARTHREAFPERALDWIKRHRQLTSWVGIAIIIGAVLLVWTMSTKRRSEEVASREVQGARFAFENGNLPLAASELARIVENYSGTNAAEEGRLVLANVRLQQGQPAQALQVLVEFAPNAGKDYRAQAHGLLGATYENLGRFREAAEAYEKASQAARMDFFKAQLLSDAGRAWTSAGETTRAIVAYRRILDELSSAPVAMEAKVRLGELSKGAPVTQE